MQDEHKNLEKVVSKLPPTESQKLRTVIYRLWEIEKRPNEPFEEYYKWRMGKIISFIINKLPH